MKKTTGNNISQSIKSKALALGFDACGIASIRFLTNEKKTLKIWLAKNYNGAMKFMERNQDKRLNPQLLVENARSIIVVLLNYYTEDRQKNLPAPKLAKYAFGKSYHHVIKNRLDKLLDFINTKTVVRGRSFVDSAPVMEKTWAEKAGLGHRGKNAILINKKLGSFFFIGELIVDIELEADKPNVKDICGNCVKCMDACPTQALVAPKVLDARRCISYHTIENRGALPDDLKGKFNNYIYGCDICQNVCPWNQKLISHNIPELKAKEDVMNMAREDWERLNEKSFYQLFKDTEMERSGLKGIRRNFRFLSK